MPAYAGNPELLLADAESDPRYHFERVDVRSQKHITCVFSNYRPNATIHLAAKAYVDRSIDGLAALILGNIVGTYNWLEVARQ